MNAYFVLLYLRQHIYKYINKYVYTLNKKHAIYNSFIDFNNNNNN